MKKFTVLATLSILAYAPVSLAGTVVTNTGINGNIVKQSNTAVGSSGIIQGGSQTGVSNQVLTGSATGSGTAVVVNSGTNGNIIKQDNTSIQAGYGKVTGATFQGGTQMGYAGQALIGTASGSNAMVSNTALNGNILDQYNTSIQQGKKVPFVVQGGSQSAVANDTLIGNSSAVSYGSNTAAVFNNGTNANVVKQENVAIQNGKKVSSANQGGDQFATANQTLTGTATSIELPVVKIKKYKGEWKSDKW